MIARLDILAAALLAALATTTTAARAHGPHETFAAGVPGGSSKPTKTVAMTIRERPDGTMSFGTATVHAVLGEEVRFVVKNDGRAPHEFRLDSVAGNAAHKAMMAEMPGMTHHDPNAMTIAPGATADLLWRFSKPGTFEFACLIPGHYEAGMHGVVIVAR